MRECDAPKVGIGYRRPHFQALPAALCGGAPWVDFVEIVAETFVLGGPIERRALDSIRSHVPVYAHGVSLSLGGPDPIDRSFARSLRRLLDDFEIPAFSEHLAWSRAGNAHSLELLPLPFTADCARYVGERTQLLGHLLERPLSLENTTFYAIAPTAGAPPVDATTWVADCVSESGAGLLLDIANLWLNAQNHGRNALQDLLALPLADVSMVHLAGSRVEPKWAVRVDDHASAVPEPVLDLYETLIEQIGAVPTLIEWDQHIPSLEVLEQEVTRVRACATRAVARRNQHPASLGPRP